MTNTTEIPGPVVLLVLPDTAGDGWDARTHRLHAVALSSTEAKSALAAGARSVALERLDREILRELATGCSVAEVERRLHLTRRTVYRRLARLRKLCGVATTGALAEVARRTGF